MLRRRWEEATVEIKGLGGEVYAIRPSGERVAQQDMQAPILNFCKDALPSWASTQKEELNPLEATQDLAALHLSTEVLDEPRTEATLPGQCEADKIEEPFFQDISVPDDLVERVARLPNHWRRALLELLEEAEAMQQWEEDQDQEQLEQPELETLAETIRQDPEVELEEPEEVEEQVQSDACEAEHSSELSKQNEALETPEASGSSEPQSEREDRLDTEAGGDVPVQSGDAPDQSEQSQIQVPFVEEVKRSEDEMPPEPTNKDLVRRHQALSKYEEMKRRYVETGSEMRFPFYGRDFGYEARILVAALVGRPKPNEASMLAVPGGVALLWKGKPKGEGVHSASLVVSWGPNPPDKHGQELSFHMDRLLAATWLNSAQRSGAEWLAHPERILSSQDSSGYHKWINQIINLTLKAIAVHMAWKLQEVISAVQSGLLGASLVGTGVLTLTYQGFSWVSGGRCCKRKFDPDKSYLDELVGLPLAAFGIWFQLKHNFSLPFPYNLALLPLTIVETVLRFMITWFPVEETAFPAH
ncbi:Uncharacterized protein SCF082_LOCUS43898 [Durusdinium trenchii]|uniref:Uncharacterized protein n=1 Tax=Durusdinium trenchii TaxID=1381693 RepID=A0ABP0QYB6_9DINO